MLPKDEDSLFARVANLELAMENVLTALNTCADNMGKMTEFIRQDRERLIALESAWNAKHSA